MRSRRSALTLLVVMIVVAGALSAAERDRTKDKPSTTPAPAVASPAAEAGREVAASLPSRRPVRARVGDTVVLRVRSSTPDIASMIELGLQTSVGPALPGELRFVAQAPGTFPVVLQLAGTKGGVVEVTAAARK